MEKTIGPQKTTVKTAKPAKIGIANLEEIKPVYSNHVLVSHTPHEFVISFCYFDHAKLTNGESPKIDAECFSRIIITPSFLPILIKTLNENQERYNEKLKIEIKKAEKVMEEKNA